MVNVTCAMFPVRPVLAHRHWIVLLVLKVIFTAFSFSE